MRTRQVAIGIVAGWISLGSLVATAATAATAATVAGAEGGPGLEQLPVLQASEAFLSQNRVKVTVNYRNQYSGETGSATAVPQGDDFAYFSFTSAPSPDVVVKVLGNNDPNWFQLFAAGLTDFEFTVTFAGCGQVRTFTQPAGGDVKYADGRGIRSAGCAPWSNEVTVTLPGGVPLTLERIPSGTFQMGSPATERNRDGDETLHTVTLTQDYYLAKFLVTQGQWQAVMGKPMSTSCGNYGIGPSYPVYCVSWDDVSGAGGFIAKLNAHLTATGQAGAGKLRLPTEAEWERAARGGTQTRFSFGDALAGDDLCRANAEAGPYAWWCNNSGSTSHPVETKGSNQYRLFDMHGNLWEWVEDWYGTYPAGPVTNPTGPSMGSTRVLRGGSWSDYLHLCRSANRIDYIPSDRGGHFGFRPAFSPCNQADACPTIPASIPQPPPGVTCNNDALTSYGELLIITPHPDDEVLGFAGLMQEFLRLSKPVRIFVVTIGDAYCDACSFWKNVGIEPSMQKWSQCTEAELAQFATIRKGETTRGQQVLGGPTPTFWGYPDTGAGTVWAAYSSGVGIDTKLRRSDCTKSSVFGAGSETDLTPRTLYNQLWDVISKSSSGTLIGTTHPMDGHPDHDGLGNMIRRVNSDLAATRNPATAPKSVAFTVIHGNTTPAGMPDHDTWYPYPGAVDGRCFDPLKQSCYLTSTTLLDVLRGYRYHPEWSFPMPQDVDYVAGIPGGQQVSFCLPTSVWQGPNASKLLAVREFVSQQGYLARTGTIPTGMAGLVDCNGYQLGFIRSNEMFVRESH